MLVKYLFHVFISIFWCDKSSVKHEIRIPQKTQKRELTCQKRGFGTGFSGFETFVEIRPHGRNGVRRESAFPPVEIKKSTSYTSINTSIIFMNIRMKPSPLPDLPSSILRLSHAKVRSRQTIA